MDQKQAEANAEQAYGQALWYAWGYMDNGQGLGPSLTAKINPQEFASLVKTATLLFNLGESHYLKSIQRQWKDYIESK